MRLAGQEKMGYYPTPLSQVTLIAPWLEVEPGKLVRLLDPCAGEGEALEALTQALAERGARVETWGVELSPSRAEKAVAHLDRVIPTDWEQTHVRDDTVSLCFLNPPYDFEGLGDSRRQELTFLKSSTPTLVPGGVLVYIIPEYVLRRIRAILRHLVGWYRDVRVWQFTPDEYEALKQIVLMGVKREAYHHPTDTETAALANVPSAPLPSAPLTATSTRGGRTCLSAPLRTGTRRRAGASACNLVELLAAITGGPQQIEITYALLGKFSDVAGPGRASVHELKQVLGLGPARAARLKAALELGQRSSPPGEDRPRSDPQPTQCNC